MQRQGSGDCYLTLTALDEVVGLSDGTEDGCWCDMVMCVRYIEGSVPWHPPQATLSIQVQALIDFFSCGAEVVVEQLATRAHF